MDDRTTELTAEEIAEKIRARKARSRWGGIFAAVGIVGFVVLSVALFYTQRAIGVGELTLLGMFFGMAAVGAGFADPDRLTSFWK